MAVGEGVAVEVSDTELQATKKTKHNDKDRMHFIFFSSAVVRSPNGLRLTSAATAWKTPSLTD